MEGYHFAHRKKLHFCRCFGLPTPFSRGRRSRHTASFCPALSFTMGVAIDSSAMRPSASRAEKQTISSNRYPQASRAICSEHNEKRTKPMDRSLSASILRAWVRIERQLHRAAARH
jgi:hypothetical protein